jgi:SAM-dependent methyltransferase
MLTPVYFDVNFTMVVAQTDHNQAQSAEQKLACRLLTPLLARRRPRRVLILKSAGASDLSLEFTRPAQLIRLNTDPSDAGAVVKCRLAALPFEEAAFDIVILHHLVCDGSEGFLSEILRVLVAGGDLVISGLNSSGLRNFFGNRKKQLPALKLNRVCSYLKSNSFNVERCLMMGIGGFSKPAPRAIWHGLGLPFADRVVLHGHHQSNVTNGGILRFRQTRSSRVASAALDGVSSRKAAS